MVYRTPFNWDYSDDKSLIMIDSSMDQEEVQKAIEEALDDFDIKLEGQDLLYKLIVNGQENGSINIPEDQFLKSATYDSETKKFTFVVGDNTIEVDAADLFDGLATSDEIAEINTKNETQDEALNSKADKSELETLATKDELATLEEKVDAIVVPDTSDFATKAEVQAVDAKVDALEIPSIDGLAKAADVTAEIAAAVEPLATKEELETAAANAVAEVVANAPEDFDTLKEVADYIASDKTKASEIEAKLSEHDATLETKADKSELEPLATKAEVQALETALNEEAQRATSVEGELQGKDTELQANIDAVDAKKVDWVESTPGRQHIVLKNHDSVLGTATDGTTYNVAMVSKWDVADFGSAQLHLNLNSKDGVATINDDKVIATQDFVGSEISTAIEPLATKAEVQTVDAKVDAIEIPDVSGFAVKSEVTEEINVVSSALADFETQVGTALDAKADANDVYTKGEIDNKIGDLGEVVEVEAQEATYWQEGDDLPDGVSVGDIKTSAVAAVTREKSVKEYVDESVQTVNEKPEVVALQERMTAMENALKRVDSNAYQTMMNDLEVLDTLKDANAVTIEEGTIGDIIIPTTTKSKTINGELEPNASLTLNSRYGVTINNTGSEPTDLEVNAPAVDGYNAATITLNGGEYDNITVTDASLTVQNGATVQNVVITEETIKNLTINAMFAEGATVTSYSNAAITLTSKNPSGEEVSVVLDAPGATVTMSGGSWVNVDANVSPNTLIINKNVHIDDLNVTQGNVVVKVARQADIANVIGNYTLAEGCTIDHLHDEIDASNVSNLTSTGTHTLIEDIAKNGRFAPGIFASDDIVWNLNGHNITFTNTQGYANFLLRGSLHLEINGQGNVVNNADDYGFWAAAEGVKIVVNGGNFEAATHVLYAEKGTIEVNGGSFKLTNPDECEKDANGNFKFLLNCKDENYTAGKANIIVRGGKFYGFNPAVTYGEPSGPVSYVASGYHVVESTEDGMKVFTVVAD